MMLESLKNLNLFRGLNDKEKIKILSSGFIKNYNDGEFIIKEGEETEQFYIVLNGVVKVVKGQGERYKILGFLKKGDFFGEMSIISNKPHTASIISKSKTKILVFLKNDFETYFFNNKIILKNLLKELAERLNFMDVEVIELAYESIKDRLLKFLQFITDNGKKEADFKLTHQEIAQIIGTNRETITRILNQLKEENIIFINDKKHIELHIK